ncbi:MAG: ABC transporter ATP-binding protein [Mollicutes bacterium]|nr:ABC transporter ATP-binding protein [Mollicutes bacterium]
MKPKAIVVENLYKYIKNKTILNNVNLSIEKGTFVAIVGCSGAGKTSLIKVLSGYSSFDKGQAYIENINIKKNLKYLKGKIGYVPQTEILDSTLTLFNSLYYSLNLRINKIDKSRATKIINNILKLFELENCKNTLIKNLSGGERKRASIATEMLSNPNIFLLDEPTSSLDANIEKKLMLKLKELTTIGKTVVITAHTISNLHLCDKIIFMGNNGKICYDGRYEDIFDHFKVEEFVDIYDLLKNNTDFWYKKHLKKIKNNSKTIKEKTNKKNIKFSFLKQTKTLILSIFSIKKSILNQK